jgi:hypothetical protein
LTPVFGLLAIDALYTYRSQFASFLEGQQRGAATPCQHVLRVNHLT